MKKVKIESLIKKEPSKHRRRINKFLKDIKRKKPVVEKENNLKKKLLLCAALWVFANSPCTNLYSPITNKISSHTEENASLSKEFDDQGAFEYISTPLIQDQINYSNGDAYIQIFKNPSSASKSLDSLLWDLQIIIQKPNFKIKYNKIPKQDKNKIVYSELWHVYGKIDGDNVTIIDVDGDKIPDILYHDKDSRRKTINLGEVVPQILYRSGFLSREKILLNPKINKKNLPYTKKESSDENKELVNKSYNLFFKCLEYFNKEVYEKKNGIEKITLPN